MILNRNTVFLAEQDLLTPPVRAALAALARDRDKVFAKTEAPGAPVRLAADPACRAEAYTLAAGGGALALTAGDDLGFVYGLYEISRRFFGVQPFWFWLDQAFAPRAAAAVAEDFSFVSAPFKVRWRGWFLNDETLLMGWQLDRRPEGPWEMAFEALLRLGGNLVIPGTDADARRYRDTAARMGLAITHHHAEPLGAEMFARAYPDLAPSFDAHPDAFRALWRQAIEEQRGLRVVWNLGFRGQGDRPFWEEDPQYNTPEKRGALISALIREQYDLVRAADPGAPCCTNLYGETMELWRQGLLALPGDVIKIWADNGYGKMVSRRQGNHDPRLPALPEPGQPGPHGLYYHVSFYDLQAASHLTPLANSAEFVAQELTAALKAGVRDYWVINASNVKPHTRFLDLIARIWRDGQADAAAATQGYAADYYGPAAAPAVAACLEGYAKAAVAYAPHEDARAGDQFYHHVPRMLIHAFMTDRAAPAEGLRWLCDLPSLGDQVAWCAVRYAEAADNYAACERQCQAAEAALTGAPAVLFADSVGLNAALCANWAEGALSVCCALAAGLEGRWADAFYAAGRAKRAYAASVEALFAREHGKWVGFYENECQTDLRQTVRFCTALMAFLRMQGDGPHETDWMRQYGDSAADRRVMLLLNTRPHPDDDALWRLMEQQRGDTGMDG